MAPLLTQKTETSLSVSASPSLGVSFVSTLPVVLTILLLLLCFPFRRKKRQLSPRVLQRERNSSQLIHIAKLEEEPSPERKPLEDENTHKGNSLSCHQDERQLKVDEATPELQHENTNSPKERHVLITNHQRTQMSPKLEVDRLRGSAPQTSCPPSPMTPNSILFRKLPMTPKEVHISRTEPPAPNVDSQIYESIRLKEKDLRSRDSSRNSPKSSKGQESKGSGKMDLRSTEVSDMLEQPDELSDPYREILSEMEAPLHPVFDGEKRLSALYAKVCKRPPTSAQSQPLRQSKTMEEEEEIPPPIPEKHFEDFYESLVIESEAQGGEMSPPKP
ncbi:uncharacterized protein LOC103280248 [Anolis carolinensis]|uniref:uncharacterized protein LOC103280248 n=1 Tax=Anolis carolinensis TaxID=28377 RepID=UPI002F2B44EB